MSFPKLGFEDQVNNSQFDISINVSKGEQDTVVKIEELFFENTYYKKLIEEGYVSLEWRLINDSTFFEEYGEYNSIIGINNFSINGPLLVEFYFVANVDFILESNSCFGDFYKSNYEIKKGSVLSKINSKKIPAFQKNRGNSLNIFTVEYSADSDEYLEIDFEQDVILITTNNEELHNYQMDFDKNKEYKLINLHVFFSSIIIEALTIIGKKKTDDKIYKWEELLIDVLEIKENERELLQDYIVAMSYYNEKFVSENFLNKIYKDLEDVIS